MPQLQCQERTTRPHAVFMFLLVGALCVLPVAGRQAEESDADSQGCCASCSHMGEGGQGRGAENSHGQMSDGLQSQAKCHSGGKKNAGLEQGMGAGPGAGGGRRELMGNIHTLVGNHERITRLVEVAEDGVVTVTRTTDPALVDTLQTHVAQMVELIENGGRIRGWDPLFVEIFENADKIEMQTELLADGIRVRETSTDPYVVKLIQAHAAKVDQFVQRGMRAMHEPTAVPEK